MSFYTSKEVLEAIKNRADFERLCFLPCSERKALETATFEFVIAFDLLVIGTCSSGLGHGYSHHAIHGGLPNKLFFEEILAENPKKVLLLSECCGQYSEEFQRFARENYPAIDWIMPEHDDYCEHLSWEKVVCDLLRSEIIRKVP